MKDIHLLIISKNVICNSVTVSMNGFFDKRKDLCFLYEFLKQHQYFDEVTYMFLTRVHVSKINIFHLIYIHTM